MRPQVLAVLEYDRHALWPLDGSEQRQRFNWLGLVCHLAHQDECRRVPAVRQVQGCYFRVTDRHDGALVQGDVTAAMLLQELRHKRRKASSSRASLGCVGRLLWVVSSVSGWLLAFAAQVDGSCCRTTTSRSASPTGHSGGSVNSTWRLSGTYGHFSLIPTAQAALFLPLLRGFGGKRSCRFPYAHRSHFGGLLPRGQIWANNSG
jgi:hypothetical protein